MCVSTLKTSMVLHWFLLPTDHSDKHSKVCWWQICDWNVIIFPFITDVKGWSKGRTRPIHWTWFIKTDNMQSAQEWWCEANGPRRSSNTDTGMNVVCGCVINLQDAAQGDIVSTFHTRDFAAAEYLVIIHPVKAINSLLAVFTGALVWRNSLGNGDYRPIWKSFEDTWVKLSHNAISFPFLPICDFSRAEYTQNISYVGFSPRGIPRGEQCKHRGSTLQTVVPAVWAVPEVIEFPGFAFQTVAKLSCKTFCHREFNF